MTSAAANQAAISSAQLANDGQSASCSMLMPWTSWARGWISTVGLKRQIL